MFPSIFCFFLETVCAAKSLVYRRKPEIRHIIQLFEFFENQFPDCPYRHFAILVELKLVFYLINRFFNFFVVNRPFFRAPFLIPFSSFSLL